MKSAGMPAIEMYIFYMCAIIGRDGEPGFVCTQYINIINMNIHDIIGCFRTDLEEITIGIANDIADFIIPCRPGKTQRTIGPWFYDIIRTNF